LFEFNEEQEQMAKCKSEGDERSTYTNISYEEEKEEVKSDSHRSTTQSFAKINPTIQ